MFRQLGRVRGRILDQLIGERLEAGLARDVRLGLAALFVRQVQVLQARLGLAAEDERLEVVRELALLLDGGKHRLLALLEFTQVRRTLLDGAQLTVVEPAGDFLAITRNKRHGIALGEQLERCLDLGLAYPDFLCNGSCNHSPDSTGRFRLDLYEGLHRHRRRPSRTRDRVLPAPSWNRTAHSRRSERPRRGVAPCVAVHDAV